MHITYLINENCKEVLFSNDHSLLSSILALLYGKFQYQACNDRHFGKILCLLHIFLSSCKIQIWHAVHSRSTHLRRVLIHYSS